MGGTPKMKLLQYAQKHTSLGPHYPMISIEKVFIPAAVGFKWDTTGNLHKDSE